MSKGIYYIELAPGTPSAGNWCEKCSLPSQIKVPVNVIAIDGVSPVGEVTYCDRCEGA